MSCVRYSLWRDFDLLHLTTHEFVESCHAPVPTSSGGARQCVSDGRSASGPSARTARSGHCALGGGGGGGGLVSSRSAATALGKVTWLFAVAFIITSLTLTIIAAQKSSSSSVLDQIGIDAPSRSDRDTSVPSGDALLPPVTGA